MEIDMLFKMKSFFDSIITTFFCLLIIMFLVNCSSHKYLYLKNNSNQITLYDKYKLSYVKAQGPLSDRTYSIFIELDFIDPLFVKNLNVDTIPILMLDSICFEGDCIGNKLCGEFVSLREHKPDASLFVNDPNADLGKYLFTPDLFYTNERGKEKKVDPLGFYVPGGINIPMECLNNKGTTILYSRLIDRVTGKTITSEAKQLQFNIKKKLKWYRY